MRVLAKGSNKFSSLRLGLLLMLCAIFAAVNIAQSAGSPAIDEVKFEKGRYVKKGSVSVPGPCPKDGPTECGNSSYTSVYIKGKKGDRIRIALTSNTGGAIFSIFLPDRSGVLEKGSSATAWTGTLPQDGNYIVTVYTRKSYALFTLTVYDH